MAKYIKRESGEGWTILNRVPFRLACCDCGLVHDVLVRARGKNAGFILGIAAAVNRRATASKRAAIRKARGEGA